MVPGDGARAPATARVWIAADRFASVDGDPAVAPVFGLAVSGVELPTTARTVRVAGEIEVALVELTPTAPLPDGATVEIVADRAGARSILARFTVGGVDELSPPARPALASAVIEGAYFGLYSCPEPSRVTLTTALPGRLLLIERPDQPADTALAIAAGAGATVVDLPPGDHQLRLVNLDAAGGRSAPGDVITVTVPPEVTGCSTAARPVGLGPLVLVFVSIAFRRRRRLRTTTASATSERTPGFGGCAASCSVDPAH